MIISSSSDWQWFGTRLRKEPCVFPNLKISRFPVCTWKHFQGFSLLMNLPHGTHSYPECLGSQSPFYMLKLNVGPKVFSRLKGLQEALHKWKNRPNSILRGFLLVFYLQLYPDLNKTCRHTVLSDKRTGKPDSLIHLPAESRRLINALRLACNGLLHGVIKFFMWFKPVTFTILQPRVLL